MSDELSAYLRAHPYQGFKPLPRANAPGQIHWYWEDVACFSESVHHAGKWVGSLHRADDDRRVVGVTIHAEAVSGLSSLLAGPASGRDASPGPPEDNP